MNLYSVPDHDGRILELHKKGMTPIEIAVTMSDVLVCFTRPSEGYVRARLLSLGVKPNRSARAQRYGKCNTRRGRRAGKHAVGLPAAA